MMTNANVKIVLTANCRRPILVGFQPTAGRAIPGGRRLIAGIALAGSRAGYGVRAASIEHH